MYYSHYSEIPAGVWEWKNFTPQEIACQGDGSILIDDHSMDALQRLRDEWGRPMRINSAYRSEAHNKAIGGEPNSQHLLGKAFDVDTSALSENERAAFIHLARGHGFLGNGLYDSFTHIDTGPDRTWDYRSKPKTKRKS